MARYHTEYRYSIEFGNPRHNWIVVGARMGVQLHITDLTKREATADIGYSAGLEFHYRTPPEHMRDDAPSHKDCWVIGGPCWHDGTSLYAAEHWVPRWELAPHDHDGMFSALIKELERREADQEPDDA